MASQTDLDQGGTFRQGIKLYLGPSVGWVQAFNNAILPVITGGTTTVAIGTTLVMVDSASPVTIQLPPAEASAAGAQALPGTFLGRPISVVDAGGQAGTGTITILPYGSETIDGATTLAISSQWGTARLYSNGKTWDVV